MLQNQFWLLGKANLTSRILCLFESSEFRSSDTYGMKVRRNTTIFWGNWSFATIFTVLIGFRAAKDSHQFYTQSRQTWQLVCELWSSCYTVVLKYLFSQFPISLLFRVVLSETTGALSWYLINKETNSFDFLCLAISIEKKTNDSCNCSIAIFNGKDTGGTSRGNL
jgi:type III secretory pathway component EscT